MSEKPNFNGKWLFHDQENFEAFLGENGVPWLVRKAVGLTKPTLAIEQNGDEMHFKLISTMKTMEDKFTVGADFEQTQPNGVVFTVTPVWEEEKLIWTLVPKEGHKGKKQIHRRFVDGDFFIMELEIGDLKAKRRFKREPKPE